MKRFERRLGAQLARDLTDYSRLMGADEFGTLAALKARRREVVAIASPKEYLKSVGASRYLVIIALLLSTVSCGGPAPTEFSVAKATVLHDPNGNVAFEVFLNERSVREFALYTTKHFGEIIEFRFSNTVLTRSRLLSPFLGGHFQISAPTLSDNDAPEIARQLSSGGAKLEVRVLETGK